MIKIDTLDDLKDEELEAVIARSNELLKERDRLRKEKALEQARATLAAVGLTLKDLANGKSKGKPGKAPFYHTGHQYQHPTNSSLVWNGKGKKPGWLAGLETEGGRAV